MAKRITNLPQWFLDLSDNEKAAYVARHPRGGIAMLWRGQNRNGGGVEPVAPQRPNRFGDSLLDSVFLATLPEEVEPVIKRSNPLGLSQQKWDRGYMKFKLDSNFLKNYKRQPISNPEYQRVENQLVDKILKFTESTDALIRASNRFEHNENEFDSLLANKPFECIRYVENKIQARLDDKTPISEQEADYLTTQLALAVAEVSEHAYNQNIKEWDYLINAPVSEKMSDEQKYTELQSYDDAKELKRLLISDARLSQDILDVAMNSNFSRAFAVAHYQNNNQESIQAEKSRLKADYDVKIQKLKECVNATFMSGVAPYGEALESIALHLSDIRERMLAIETAEKRFAAKMAA